MQDHSDKITSTPVSIPLANFCHSLLGFVAAADLSRQHGMEKVWQGQLTMPFRSTLEVRRPPSTPHLCRVAAAPALYCASTPHLRGAYGTTAVDLSPTLRGCTFVVTGLDVSIPPTLRVQSHQTAYRRCSPLLPTVGMQRLSRAEKEKWVNLPLFLHHCIHKSLK